MLLFKKFIVKSLFLRRYYDLSNNVTCRINDTMCDIECAETPSSNEPLTWHCAMAADLVTILGNTIDVDEDEESDD